jgi:hypothetical protein
MTTSEFSWAVAESLVASVIFAGGVTLWKRLDTQRSYEEDAVEHVFPQRAGSASASVMHYDDDRRSVNRRKIQSAVFEFFFYFFSFMALYLSIAMPPLFQAMWSKQPILLSQARLIGDYLPDVVIGKSTLQLSFLLMAMVLYLPLLKLSEVILAVIRPLLDTVVEVTRRKAVAYTMFIQYVLCIPIATGSVWCFSQKTLEQSFMTVVAAVVMAIVVGMASQNKQR